MHGVGMMTGWTLAEATRDQILSTCVNVTGTDAGKAECIIQTINAWVPRGFSHELITQRCQEMTPELKRLSPGKDWCAVTEQFYQTNAATIAPTGQTGSTKPAASNAP